MSNTNNNNFNTDDLILYKEGGKIMSGGYSVDSTLMQSGTSPLTSYFNGGANKTLEGVSDFSEAKETPFKNMAIPVGIFYINQQSKIPDYEKKSYDDTHYKRCDMLPDDMYDRLFELASFKQKKHETKDMAIKKEVKEVKSNKITKNQNKKNPIKKTKRLKPM